MEHYPTQAYPPPYFSPSEEIEEIPEAPPLPNIPLPSPQLNVTERTQTGNILLSWLLALFGGFLVGYGFSLSVLVTSINGFLKFIDYGIYKRKMHAHWTNYCAYTDWTIVFICLLPLLCACFARICTHRLCCIWGVKCVLVLSYLAVCVGSLMCPWKNVSFFFGAIVSGLGLGAANMVVQIYLSDTSSAANKSKLERVFSSTNAFGILTANVTSYIIASKKLNGAWRVMFYVGAAVSGVLFLCSLGAVQGPRLEKFKIKMIWKSKYRPWLVISLVYQGFSALAGGVAITFFMPTIYDHLALSKHSYLVYPSILFIITIVGCFGSIFLLERVGRKKFMLFSTSAMTFFLVLITLLVNYFTKPNVETDIGIVVCIFIFMCMFSVTHTSSFGPVGWLKDTFPEEVLWTGVSVSSNFNTVFSFLVAQFAIFLICETKALTFMIFAIVNALMILFIYLFLPNTDGISANEMEEIWINHWFWNKYDHGGAPLAVVH